MLNAIQVLKDLSKGLSADDRKEHTRRLEEIETCYQCLTQMLNYTMRRDK